MSWSVIVAKRVWKEIEKVPQNDAGKILLVLKEEFSLNPYQGDIEKMKGEHNTWRRRVGAYRIFYKIKVLEKIILVFNLERRTSKTY